MSKTPMFDKILIANRGEIACRIIKTAHRLGVETVAVYSEADRNSLHVQQATEAIYIGAAPASASYLNIEALLKAANISQAQAIHPGYGFLSENPRLAEACKQAGIIFIGPDVSAMQAMASKQTAKTLLEKTKVPLTPGYHGEDQSDDRMLQEATRIGFPVLLKAAAGGGGKGMRQVEAGDDFILALTAARREAKASFGDDTLLIEKRLINPRHIEIQLMADNHGHVVHLFERDCSIQRRHQKIIEEAQAPHCSKALLHELAAAAITVAQTIHYRGAGTVEFLVDQNDHFYFMEMNTRLQVEHPVTEMITGLDLVEWQLRIAAGESLPSRQEALKTRGHAIECRIYAEDPAHHYLPSTGYIDVLKEPEGDGIRIDTGITRDSMITQYYDPMMAKLIVWGEHREQAISRLKQALKAYVIGGVKTNIPFLQAIVNHPRFIKHDLDIDFLAQTTINLPIPDTAWASQVAAAFDYLTQVNASGDPLYQDTFAWQLHLQSSWQVRYKIEDTLHEYTLLPINQQAFILKSALETRTFQTYCLKDELVLDDGTSARKTLVHDEKNDLRLYHDGHVIVVHRFNEAATATSESESDAQLTAPMPATVVAVLKQKGDLVQLGECIMILEAMKMEHAIHAPFEGIITDLFYEVGAQVNEGVQLLDLNKKDAHDTSTRGDNHRSRTA